MFRSLWVEVNIEGATSNTGSFCVIKGRLIIGRSAVLHRPVGLCFSCWFGVERCIAVGVTYSLFDGDSSNQR